MNKVEDLRYMFSPGSFKKSKEVDVGSICIRVTLPLSNDRKAVREYCLPDTLSKHHKWTEADVPVGLNK
ncbi:hypothetical protein [Pontiella sulfatireligans]|nr:hypothetical protein [Pontiella sulfatireligans]